MNKQKKKLPLAMQIFIALILAIVVGLLIQSQAAFAESYIKPFGTIFLNLLKFIVVPIVLFSIMCGIISMRDIKKVGAIGLKTVLYYMCTTAFAITIGLIGGNIFQRFFPVIATTDLAYEMPEKNIGHGYDRKYFPIQLYQSDGGIQHAAGYCHCAAAWIFHH